MALKPQDLVVAFKLAISDHVALPYSELAEALGLSASEVHGGVGRLKLARLANVVDERLQIVRAALREFVLHGANYSFPATHRSATRGMPTSYAVAPLQSQLTPSDDLPPVWPDPHGTKRGIAFQPLYPTVPLAARKDPALYEILALFDALRGGAARERQIAHQMLSDRLA